MSSITVITPTIPEREHMLSECAKSIQAQTLKPAAHLIATDAQRFGIVPTVNQLVQQVETEWFATLADDDLADPDHLEVLHANSGPNVDFVYSLCRVTGDNAPSVDNFHGYPPVLTWTALYRTETWRRLGGYANDGTTTPEDRVFWTKAVSQKCNFIRVEQVTWTYRFHDTNASHHP